MEFCYTRPLQRRLTMKPPFSQTAAAPFFCWDVHLLTVQGRKAVLAMNRASRYSILLYTGGTFPSTRTATFPVEVISCGLMTSKRFTTG